MSHDRSLTIAQACKIVIISFLLSQGDFGLQGNLLLFVAATHPTWRLPMEMEPELVAALMRSCTRFLTYGWHKPLRDYESIEEEVRLKVEEFRNALQDDPRPSRPLLLVQIMEGIVRRDALYLMSGRPRLRLTSSGSTPRASFFSHFVHYGLLHRPTGAPEFDALFRAIEQAYVEQGELWRRFLAQPGMRFCMGQVLTAHNTYYPALQMPIPASLLLDGGMIS